MKEALLIFFSLTANEILLVESTYRLHKQHSIEPEKLKNRSNKIKSAVSTGELC